MAFSSSHIAAVLQAMSVPIPSDTLLDENSAFHKLNDIAGLHDAKSVTLDGNGASVERLFTVTGTCRILLLRGNCTEATDSTTLSGVKWETDDGTAQSDISGVVNASGAVAGALLLKAATAAGATQFINPTAGTVTDAGAKKLFEPFLVSQKTGGIATYIRLAYTGDATSDTDWTFEVHYVPFTEDAAITAV